MTLKFIYLLCFQLQLAVLTGRCPIAKVADMMICASGYEDATPCCQAYGVFEPGFEHCRPYCNPVSLFSSL